MPVDFATSYPARPPTLNIFLNPISLISNRDGRVPRARGDLSTGVSDVYFGFSYYCVCTVVLPQRLPVVIHGCLRVSHVPLVIRPVIVHFCVVRQRLQTGPEKPHHFVLHPRDAMIPALLWGSGRR